MVLSDLRMGFEERLVFSFVVGGREGGGDRVRADLRAPGRGLPARNVGEEGQPMRPKFVVAFTNEIGPLVPASEFRLNQHWTGSHGPRWTGFDDNDAEVAGARAMSKVLGRPPLEAIPSEGYGFGNDASAAFGPPSFESAAVAVGDASSVAVLTLSY